MSSVEPQRVIEVALIVWWGEAESWEDHVFQKAQAMANEWEPIAAWLPCGGMRVKLKALRMW